MDALMMAYSGSDRTPLNRQKKLLVWQSLRILVRAIFVVNAAACTPSTTSVSPNILLVTIDTIRADHCSSYGYDRLTTPTMSQVAEAGVLFRNAYSPMATTGPSHATLLTSLYPRTHGCVKNGLVLDQRVETLPEGLKDTGYHTVAIVSSFPLAARFGFNQGFDLFDDNFEADGRELKPRQWEGFEVETFFDRDAAVTTNIASNWLRNERRQGRPFFLWVHYFDPHSPYSPADDYRFLFLAASAEDDAPGPLERKIALYDAEIRETDDALGRLLQVVGEEGLTESTVVVIAGDHGEGLMQHGHMQHGVHIYEEAVRVPLVVSWPGVLPAGIEIHEPVQLLDIKPTLLEITGVVGGAAIQQGESLVGIMTGRQRADPDRPVFFERRRYKTGKIGDIFVSGNKLGIRSGFWKYIEADEEGTRELFDLRADPLESSNLAGDYPELVDHLSGEIGRWVQKSPRMFIPPDISVSKEDTRKLEALGYVE